MCRLLMQLFGVVQAHRTSSNLPEPHHYRDSKVCKLLSHEFGVVRPYRTFSIYIVTGETRSAGCLCTSSGCFKHIEPHRIFSNHIITEIARCVELCHMSSGEVCGSTEQPTTELESPLAGLSPSPFPMQGNHSSGPTSYSDSSPSPRFT